MSKDIYAVTLEKAMEYVPVVLKSGNVPLLEGPPGLGKSAVVIDLANRLKLKLIDLRLSQCEAVDILGYPHISKDSRSSYAPMDTFPLQGDPIPNGYRGFLIFLDEIGHASEEVEKAAHKLIEDRLVGQTPLHPKCFIVAATNGVEDSNLVTEMSSSMISRLVKLVIKPDVDKWLDWAENNNVNHMITSFIQYKKSALYNFNPNNTGDTFASPRTWVKLSNIIKAYSKELDQSFTPVVAGTVGRNIAHEFVSYTCLFQDLVTIEQIVEDPEGTPIPNKMDIAFATAAHIGQNCEENQIIPIIKYAKRFGGDIQVITLRALKRKFPNILTECKEFDDWLTETAQEFF